MKDLFGKAILDYQTQHKAAPIITETNISEADEMEVAYLFRKFDKMPEIEQQALKLAKGRILDVGCGAGSHSLYLKEKNHEVFPIDISENAVKACHMRGLGEAKVMNILDVKDEKFDTIYLLMNGTGIFGKLKNCTTYLSHLKTLLNDNGQILIDSSDLIYMFEEDEDGGKWIPMENDYYGELQFIITYENEQEEPFDWLFLDYNTLQNACHANGLQCELLLEGDNYDYLARITL